MPMMVAVNAVFIFCLVFPTYINGNVQKKVSSEAYDLDNKGRVEVNLLKQQILQLQKEIERLHSKLEKNNEELRLELKNNNEEKIMKNIDHTNKFSSSTYMMTSSQIYDIQWQALHMAAAAACRGSTPTGGSGCCANAVYPKVKGKSCNTICIKTNYNKCDAELAINGYRGKAKSPYKRVGMFYNYRCEHSNDHSLLENEVNEDYLWGATNNYIRYCCCRRE